MTFEHLPKNWPELSLRDVKLGADVVDLLLGYRDRINNSLLLLPCSPTGLAHPAPIILGDLVWTAGPESVVKMWSELSEPDLTLLLATSHSGYGQHRIHRNWLTKATIELAKIDTEVIGCYTAALDRVHIGPVPKAVAA